MLDIRYGVVFQNGAWVIIGPGLRFGAYSDRAVAVAAAQRLARESSGLPVELHLQDETGELKPPMRVS